MKKKSIKILLFTIIIVLVNILVYQNVNFDKKDITVELQVKGDNKDIYQVFYSHGEPFQDKFINQEYNKIGDYQTLKFSIPHDIEKLRFDLGNQEGDIYIREISINYLGNKSIISPEVILVEEQLNDIGNRVIEEDQIKVTSIGADPIITFNKEKLSIPRVEQINKQISYIIKGVACVITTLFLIFLLRMLPLLVSFGKELYNNRNLIIALSKNDFKTKFAGSYLGITWAFVQPIVVVLIYWFVFEVGFKSAPMEDFPFLLWLIAGIIPWFFFNESLMNATNSLIEYSYLVKKVVFKISILPIVKIMSAFYVHIFFIIFANIVYLLYGYAPSIYIIQCLYYSLCTFILVLGISYATSAIVVFFKDLGQIVNILLQFGMWMTPIMWSYDMMPQNLQRVLKINPMYYIVEGYRDTFIRHVWFWERYNQTIYFWSITLCLFGIGALIFRKTKTHFSDVL
ncbi:MAG: ABC transporter permease [Zhenhengia sp.]|uniref:ABC transporter permease n=1 Tax=Zhenhengia sp. TaxID=2944208 RepID=UPI003993BC57